MSPRQRHEIFSPQDSGEEFPYDWGLGNRLKEGLIAILKKYVIPSVIGVKVDTFLVHAIFGQRSSKPSYRHHFVKSLSLTAPETDVSIREDVWKNFEDLKQHLTQISDNDNNGSPSGYMETVEKSCPKFMKSFPGLEDREGVEKIFPWFVPLR